MDVLFIIGNWNAKVESQQISGVTGKFALGVQIEARQRLTEFCQENALLIEDTLPNSIRDNSTHGHHHVVNTKIRLTTFFAAKDGEVLYSQKTRPRADCGSDHQLLIAKFAYFSFIYMTILVKLIHVYISGREICNSEATHRGFSLSYLEIDMKHG